MPLVQTLKPAPGNHQDLAHKRLSPEQFEHEVDYYRATIILEKMLQKGLITQEEYHKIDSLNRQSFSPQLASIMA